MFLSWTKFKFIAKFFVIIGIAKNSSLDDIIWHNVRKLSFKLKDSNSYAILYMGYELVIMRMSYDKYCVFLNGHKRSDAMTVKKAKAYGLVVLSNEIKNGLVL